MKEGKVFLQRPFYLIKSISAGLKDYNMRKEHTYLHNLTERVEVAVERALKYLKEN